MKKFLSFGLLSLCSFSIYASQCNIDFEKKNYEKALEKCTQKAEQGDANAQTVLGLMYYKGDGFANQLLASSQAEHEAFWRLPLADFHRSQFPSSFADMANSGLPNTAGASTAAAFLSHFIKNYKQNWLHIDCSATFRKSATALWATGATGIGIRTLANLLNVLK